MNSRARPFDAALGIADIDKSSVTTQVFPLNSSGVQFFDAVLAGEVARIAKYRAAE